LHGDAGGELTAGRLDVEQPEPVATNVERRDRVAAGIDGEQHPVRLVVDQRALRGQAVGLGARRGGAAEAAGGIHAGLAQAAVRASIEDDDPVPVQLVRLDEHDVRVPSVSALGGRGLGSCQHGGSRHQQRCE
jgi:hypothetical protein